MGERENPDPSPPQLALPSGFELLWYRLERVLGQGGFGITYLALDSNLDTQVAIKEFLATAFATRGRDATVVPLTESHREDFAWGLERFITEGQTLARFDHPAIVRVHSVFEANQTAYMVMRYEQGKSLAEMLAGKQTFPETQLADMVLRLLEGLEQVHEAGFIHRDIKPANIYIHADGSPVLLDFGAARQALGVHTQTLTTMVSPGYAPIEQYASSSASQGPWTDIYALAATLYRMVTGTAPLSAVDRSKVILDTGRDPLVLARDAAGDGYSASLLAAIDHGLAFREGDRPQTIAHWRAELSGQGGATVQPVFAHDPEAETVRGAEVLTEEITTKGETGAIDVVAKKRRRWPRVIGILAVVLLVLAVLGSLGEKNKRASKIVDVAEDSKANHSQPQSILTLLTAAAQDLDALRLTTPAGDNAWEKYREVLVREPDNRVAQDGLRKIVSTYLGLAKDAASKGELGRADDYLGRAALVLPDDQRLRNARERLAAARSPAPVEPAVASELRHQTDLDKKSQKHLREARKAADKKDYRRAARLLAKVAEKGSPEAQYWLGALYTMGRGVRQDYAKAARLFQAAAHSGFAQAQHNLAVLLDNGRGVARDPVAARRWYQRAAAQGFEPAIEALAKQR